MTTYLGPEAQEAVLEVQPRESRDGDGRPQVGQVVGSPGQGAGHHDDGVGVADDGVLGPLDAEHVEDADEQEAQRLRLMTSSHLDDGEFARLLYGKVGDLIGPVFTTSLERAIAAGEASRIGSEPLNLFWFAHHTVLMAALARLPAVPCLTYGNAADLERQLCEFILRGIGLNEAAFASHLDREMSAAQGQSVAAESA